MKGDMKMILVNNLAFLNPVFLVFGRAQKTFISENETGQKFPRADQAWDHLQFSTTKSPVENICVM
jgi:hypothetical protein